MEEFIKEAGELYNVAPYLFQIAITAIFSVVGGAIWGSWWLRGYLIESRTDSLKSQIASCEAQLKLAKDQNDSLKGQVANLEALITSTKDQNDNLKNQIASIEAHVESVKTRHQIAKQEADGFRSEVASLREQIRTGASTSDLASATAHLDSTLENLISANNVVSGALAPIGAWLKSLVFEEESGAKELPAPNQIHP